MRYAIFLLLLLAGPAFSAEPVYSWHYRADDPDRVYLYRDGKQIGGWCYQAKHYRSLDGDTWGRPTSAAPVPPPTRVTQIQLNLQPAVQPLVIRRGLPLRGKVTEAIVDSMSKQMATMAGEAMAKLVTQAVGDLTVEMLNQLPGVKKK